MSKNHVGRIVLLLLMVFTTSSGAATARVREVPQAPTADCATFGYDGNYPDGTVVQPGQAINKIWGMNNCGTTNWNGYQVVRIGGTYGPTSFTINSNYPPGSGEIWANITVPTTAGTHRATYQLRNNSGVNFGDPFWVEIVVQQQQANNCASFGADLSIPDGTQVQPGQTINKGWRMYNCGNTTWSGYQAVRINGSFGPASFAIPATGPGANAEFWQNITVPSTAGTHRATYQLRTAGGANFGDTFWIEVNVQQPANNCASFGADLSIPDGTQVQPGQTVNKGWRMYNCGNTTWSGYQAVRINGSFGPASFAIPATGPGANAEFWQNITVPSTAGTHRATYQLRTAGGANFGDTFWIEVNVQQQANNCASYVSDLSIPDGTQVQPGQTVNKGWRMYNCGNTTWSGYQAVRINGSFGPASFAIPATGPGANTDIWQDITAPSTAGTHRATYQLRTAGGANFGDTFWIEVNVQQTNTVACMQYISDLNYPDGAIVQAGQTITKRWRLNNCGTSAWSGVQAFRTAGSYGPTSFVIPNAGAQQNVDVEATITVPSTPGVHRATYQLRTAGGTNFGDPFWVEIVVQGDPGPVEDTHLLAPIHAGKTLRVVHGYNDPIPGETCVIGIGPDHCDNQRYGLDLRPDDQADTDILAPLPGTIGWIDGDCLGIRTTDNLNLNLCHFSSFDVQSGDPIARGAVLGTRSTSWIHLSLDDRYNNPGTKPPIILSGAHSFEGMDLTSNGTRDQYNGLAFTSTNGSGGPGGNPSCSLGMQFISETIPDGTTMQAGEQFMKTWTVQNTSSCAWDSSFRLVFDSGNQMGAASSIGLPNVATNAQGTLAVNMTAPATTGIHRGNWKLVDSAGRAFGWVWVEILVAGTGQGGIILGYPPAGHEGTYWNMYDQLIIQAAAAHTLPPALLKGVVAHESAGLGRNGYDPTRAFLYEGYTIDYYYVQPNINNQTLDSRYNPYLLPDNPPANENRPFSVFTGLFYTIPSGTTARTMGTNFPAITDNLPAYGVQNIPAAEDFTAQYRLASSYGLGQIIYYFHANKIGYQEPETFYDPSVVINNAASLLGSHRNNISPGLGDTSTNFDDWWSVLVAYNGDNNYPSHVRSWYNASQPIAVRSTPDFTTELAQLDQAKLDLAQPRFEETRSPDAQVEIDRVIADLKGNGQPQLVVLYAQEQTAGSELYNGQVVIFNDTTETATEWMSLSIQGTSGFGKLQVHQVAGGPDILSQTWASGFHSFKFQAIRWNGTTFAPVVIRDGTTPLQGSVLAASGSVNLRADLTLVVSRRGSDAIAGRVIEAYTFDGQAFSKSAQVDRDLRPDLTLSVEPHGPITNGQVTVTIRVKNQGTQEASGFFVGHTAQGGRNVTNLPADTEITWTATYTTNGQPLKLETDLYRQVHESDESNNSVTLFSKIYLPILSKR